MENYSSYLSTRAQAMISERDRGPEWIRKGIKDLLEKTEKDLACQQIRDLYDFSFLFLYAIETKVLILYGGKDQLVDPRHSLYLRKHLKNSIIYEFPFAGHAPHLIYNYNFNRILSNFFQGRHMRYQISSNFLQNN